MLSLWIENLYHVLFTFNPSDFIYFLFNTILSTLCWIPPVSYICSILTCLHPFSVCCEWMLHEKPQASIFPGSGPISLSWEFLLLLLRPHKACNKLTPYGITPSTQACNNLTPYWYYAVHTKPAISNPPYWYYAVHTKLAISWHHTGITPSTQSLNQAYTILVLPRPQKNCTLLDEHLHPTVFPHSVWYFYHYLYS